MAELQACPSGLAASQATGLLLEALGKDAPGRDLPEFPGEIQPEQAVSGALERLGYSARWVDLSSDDLPGLRLPTLAARRDGTFLFLRGWRRGKVRVESMGEVANLRPSELQEDRYLEWVGPLPSVSLWKAIGGVFLGHRRVWGPFLALAALAQVSGLLLPHLTRLMVDRVFPTEARSLFALIVLAMAATGAYQAWMSWMQRQYELALELRMSFEIEAGLLGHLLRLPFPWLSRRTVGDLLQGFFGIGAARQFLLRQVSGNVMNSLLLLGYFVSMVWISPLATLVVIAGTAIQVGTTLILGRRLVQLETVGVITHVKERSLLVEVLRGIGVIKASGAESRLEAQWFGLVQRRRLTELKGGRLHLAAQCFLDIFQGLLLQGITLWTSIMVLQGQIRLGEMLAFAMMATAFQNTLSQTAELFLHLVRLKPTLGKVEEILAEEREPAPFPMEAGAAPIPISIEDVWFRYDSRNPWILKAFQAGTKPGERILLQGPSGCGKSSLLRLLAGLQEPDRGRILLGNLPPREAREKIAYLPQSILLFSGSLLDNLKILSNGASRSTLLDMAEETGLADLVRTLPMGWETVVAQGGYNFSGGQRQLVALTAVMASRRQVLLLDEAMANLDPLWKERLLAKDLFQGKTVLLASHEDSRGRVGPEVHGFRPLLLCEGKA